MEPAFDVDAEQDREVLRAEAERREVQSRAFDDELRARKTELAASQQNHAERVRTEARRLRRRRLFWVLGTISAVGVVVAGLFAFGVFEPVEAGTLTGEVRAVEGPAPTLAGDRCRIVVEPVQLAFDAQLFIDCGGRRIYGFEDFGYVDCTSEKGEPLKCYDRNTIARDGDPELALDEATGELLVQDDGWSFEVELGATP